MGLFFYWVQALCSDSGRALLTSFIVITELLVLQVLYVLKIAVRLNVVTLMTNAITTNTARKQRIVVNAEQVQLGPVGLTQTVVLVSFAWGEFVA